MKITFTLDAATANRLTDFLAFLEIPATAIADMAKEHVECIAEDRDVSYVAEGYVYDSRESARRVADKILQLYPGNREIDLRYRTGSRVQREDFRNPKGGRAPGFALIASDRVPFSTALPRDHMAKVSELLAALEIPPNEIQKLFRQTLESETWHEDWMNWTADYVYPSQKAAARVAKRIAKLFPNDPSDIRLSFFDDGKQVTATFPRRKAA
jgi:hypothetical protein